MQRTSIIRAEMFDDPPNCCTVWLNLYNFLNWPFRLLPWRKTSRVVFATMNSLLNIKCRRLKNCFNTLKIGIVCKTVVFVSLWFLKVVLHSCWGQTFLFDLNEGVKLFFTSTLRGSNFLGCRGSTLFESTLGGSFF